MNISTRRLRILLPLLLLAACARPDTAPIVVAPGVSCPPPPALAMGENGMLRYYRCLSTLPPVKLAAEYDGVNRHFKRSGAGADRVKLAMLQSIPDTAFYNPASGLRLLTPPPGADAVPDDLRDLAGMLRVALQRQQVADQKLHDTEKDLAAEKLHAEALQVKINSVKDLERTMTKREAQ